MTSMPQLTSRTPSSQVPINPQACTIDLKSLEKKYQALWASQRLFEVNAPSLPQTAHLTPAQLQEAFPKWFGTFPYPYMNGPLHLGHAFTISKVEFAAGYQRMLGKRVLLPHGFHVSGSVIKASADKIRREVELFGPDLENYRPPGADEPPGDTYQFQRLESMGVPRREIKKFADSQHWLTYWPSIAMADNKAFGSRIDWRRSFITTSANPYYDAFVRWQFNKLHVLGKIKFGKRYVIYNPMKEQPCMDHDRQYGDGIRPQEYTAIKLEVKEWSKGAKEIVEGQVGERRVFLVATTTRPEIMYGQTNCFVSTTIKYGIFAISEKEAYISTTRAALNMAFQGISTPFGKINLLLEIDGAKIVGTVVKAPFAINPEVYVLPMENIPETKGTGVLTSVPSDCPDDYQTLLDLREMPELYNIDLAWASIDPVPIIATPTYGQLTAPALVKTLRIRSQRDKKQLAETAERAYAESFDSGVMLVEEFKGVNVHEARAKVRERMIQAGLAFVYAEPDGLVVSWSDDECVVALMDHWYLDYGEKEWKARVEKLLANMELYDSETRNALRATLVKLNEWACVQTYGLGSTLPWDLKFVVESLSDSTIYMCYYTVAQLLHENSIDGSRPGPLGILPEQMTDEIWEYIFCDGHFPSPSSLPREKADALKHEYHYFYPFNIRSTGKELVPNHLTFSVYSHVALLPENKWPLSIRTNGHLLLNGEKMSKTTGNFLMMRQIVEKFGADSTRLSLADMGDGVGHVNFEEEALHANMLRVHALLAWCIDMIKEEPNMRQGPKISYHDRLFEEEINHLIKVTQGHYEATNYKNALKYGFHEMHTAREWYRTVTTDIGMHKELVRYWISTAALLATPIAPHFAEHIWSSILCNPTSIHLARWPTPSRPVDSAIIEGIVYLRRVVKTIHDTRAAMLKKMGNCDALALQIYVATTFPKWQDLYVEVIKDSYSTEESKVDDVKLQALLKKRSLVMDERAAAFVQTFKERIDQLGPETALRRTMPFSESAALMEILPYLKKTLNMVDLEVLPVEEASSKEGLECVAEPGSPTLEYRTV